MKRRVLMGLPLLVILLDQLSKSLFENANRVLLPGVLRLHGAKNTGASFGWLSGNPILLTIVSAATVLLLLLYLVKTRPGGLYGLGLGLLLGGAAGNLIDRLRLGYVVDFIELLFVRFAVFNLADTAITLGTLCAAAGLFLSKEGSHA